MRPVTATEGQDSDARATTFRQGSQYSGRLSTLLMSASATQRQKEARALHGLRMYQNMFTCGAPPVKHTKFGGGAATG